MSRAVLELKQVNKSFGSVPALRDVNLSVTEKQIFGIIGPNGSGKTTLIRIILSLAKPDSGTVKLFGSTDLPARIKRTGALLEGTGFYPDFSVEKNLKIAAYVKNAPAQHVETVLDQLKLSGKRTTPYKHLSLGMKQRLLIASALLGNPDLLVLDEPTNGLDPTGIIELRHLLHQLNRAGKTILLASHLLSEMEKICTDIAILNQGTILRSDSMGGMKNRFPSLEDAYVSLVEPV
jgi:ABC-2 type transport system ATP-binding protein